ncbi:MAG: hypothetical protein ACR2LK_10395 [Solirubrobacteraceae bacterium]
MPPARASNTAVSASRPSREVVPLPQGGDIVAASESSTEVVPASESSTEVVPASDAKTAVVPAPQADVTETAPTRPRATRDRAVRREDAEQLRLDDPPDAPPLPGEAGRNHDRR